MEGKFDRIRKKVSVSDSEQTSRRSEWQHTCQAFNCPLGPSASFGGFQVCSFHLGSEPGHSYANWNAISYAIKQELTLVKKINGLYLKGADFWNSKTQVAALMGWPFCSMKENEQVSSYLMRLNGELNNLIKQKATEAMEKGYV